MEVKVSLGEKNTIKQFLAETRSRKKEKRSSNKKRRKESSTKLLQFQEGKFIHFSNVLESSENNFLQFCCKKFSPSSVRRPTLLWLALDPYARAKGNQHSKLFFFLENLDVLWFLYYYDFFPPTSPVNNFILNIIYEWLSMSGSGSENNFSKFLRETH